MKESVRSLNLMYNYFIEQYRRGLFKMSSLEMAEMGGLVLYSETSNSQNAVFDFEKLLPKAKFR